MLSSLPCVVTFMWQRGVLRGVFLIIHKRRLARRLSCNRFMAPRQRTKISGLTKKVTCLFFHQEKNRFQQKRIWTFFVALESKLMMTMILNQRTPMNRKSNRKGTDKKAVRCGNKRAVYALARKTIFIIILHFFGTSQKRRC